ncbi:MAG: GTP-binding protein [Candidatus Lokiarchaeota archaeon]|nr:GTP-binding protein [Candidatus Lokiarchaeota archaeon]
MQYNIFKIIIAGDGGTGKTTLIQRYVNSVFVHNTLMTIGVQFYLKDNGPIHLQLWDFGGQERFRFMLDSYTTGARSFAIILDATRIRTLNKLDEWLGILKKRNPNLVGVLGMSKIDQKESIEITDDYAIEIAEKYNMPLVKFSSKTGEGVESLFNIIMNQCIYQLNLDIDYYPMWNLLYRDSILRTISNEIESRETKVKIKEKSTALEASLIEDKEEEGEEFIEVPEEEIKQTRELNEENILQLLWEIHHIQYNDLIKDSFPIDLDREQFSLEYHSEIVESKLSDILESEYLSIDVELISDLLQNLLNKINHTINQHIIQMPNLDKIIKRYKQNLDSSLPDFSIIAYYFLLSEQLFFLSLNTFEANLHLNLKQLQKIVQSLETFDNPFATNLLGNLYFLIGMVLLENNPKNSGIAFFHAMKFFHKIKNLLASKCFYLSMSLLSVNDHDYIQSLIYSHEDLLSELCNAKNDYRIGNIEEEMNEIVNFSDIERATKKPINYIMLALKMLDAVDYSNRDPAILDSLYTFIELGTDDDYLEHILIERTSNALSEIEETMDVAIINPTIKPEFPELNDPLQVETRLLNIMNKRTECSLRLIAPGTEYPESIVKLKVKPKKFKKITFNVGRSSTFGDLIYSLQLLDEDGFLLYHRDLKHYIVDPSENLRFTKLEYNSNEVKENIPVTITITVKNTSKTKESCVLNISSNLFDLSINEIDLNIGPDQEVEKIIELGYPCNIGEGNVYLKLFRDEDNRLCDSKSVPFYVKKSHWRTVKNIAIGVLKGATSFI